jgi:hypothetical protein
MMFKRRLGPDPHAHGGTTGSVGAKGCPDIWELTDGSFAIIGIRKTKELQSILPPTATCGQDEEIVIVPRGVLIGARDDIPNE